MIELLSNSRTKSFRACPRKHHYQYVLRARPVVESEALRFGTLVHRGLENWWRDHELSVDGLTADDYEFARAVEMMRGYDARWSEQDLEVIGVELEFRLPMINPDTNMPSRTFVLGGKLDALVRTPDRRVWVVEHKTSSEDISPGSEYWRRLRMDSQVSIYIDAAKTLGYDVAGCIYDVLGKPDFRPKRATPEESRKFTKGKKCRVCKGVGGFVSAVVGLANDDGLRPCNTCHGSGWEDAPRLYAGQRDIDETPEEYGARIRASIAEDPNRYYQRAEVVRLDTELDEHRRDLWQTAQTMRRYMREELAPRNPASCVSYSRTCEFFDVCCGMASIEDPGLYTIGKKHPELSEEKAA